jgi:hypothetical protein
MERRITIIVITAAILSGLMYAAHTIDLFGIAQRMHGM